MFVEIVIDRTGVPRKLTTRFSFMLRPSSIEGVGVFSTHAIKKGTWLRLFSKQKDKSKFVSRSRMGKDPVLNSFCLRFGVEELGGVWVPDDFGCMSVGWYLNHSDHPNAHHDKNYDYFASRNIEAGEEITIDYHLL